MSGTVNLTRARIERLQRHYAAALRTAEEHKLPLFGHLSVCCHQEVWLGSPTPEVVDCPHCGRTYPMERRGRGRLDVRSVHTFEAQR